MLDLLIGTQNCPEIVHLMHCICGTKESSNSTEEAAHERAARDFRNDAGVVCGDPCSDWDVVKDQ